MKIILNTEESYSLTELAKAVENSPDDLFYVVKKVDGKDVSFAITREQLLLGITGGGADSRFIISGGVVWTGTGLVFDVTAINYNFYGTVYIAPAVQITLDNGDSDPRFDSFVVDKPTNTVVVIKGTPAANPQIPQPGEDQIFITSVLVGAGATTPTITNDFVYRDNADYTTSTYTIGSPTPGTVDFESTNDPFEGTFCIDSNTSRSTGMRFQRTGSIELGTDTGQFSSLSFRIRFDAPLPANRNLLASVGLSGSSVGVAANFMPYGIDRNLVGVWQTIVIPTGIFSATEIDRIQIRMDGGTNAQQVEYFLDYIVFATGIVAPAQVPTITIQKDGTTIGNRPKLNLIEGPNTTIAVVDDPVNDRVNITITATGGGGGGQVDSVEGFTDEIDVDDTDPVNPIVRLALAVRNQLLQIAVNIGLIAALDDRVDDLETDLQAVEVDVADLQADKYDASNPDGFITESDVIGTLRDYTAAQGFQIETLAITAGTPNIVNWSTDTSNAKYLALTSDAVLQVPTGNSDSDHMVSGSIEVLNSGGFTLTFNAGLNPDFILGDTPTTTDTEYFKIDWERRGTRIWLIVNNQNA